MAVRFDVPLASWTTIRLGGPASRFADASSEDDLVELIEGARKSGDPVFILGGGSNVVVADAGFAGMVIHMASRGIEVRADADRVLVDVAAGEPLDGLVERAVAEGWSGLECLSGIPGLVGATPIQNVGAYGQEVADTIVDVRAFDRAARRFVHLAPSDCRFGYRTSVFRGNARYVVTRVRFGLARSDGSRPVRYAELARALGIDPGAIAPLSRVRDAVIELRRAKGMVWDPGDPETVSAGSFFVNPVLSPAERDELEARLRDEGVLADGATMPGFASAGGWKVPAAWLIERAGFPRGSTRGRVGVSARHALALVNRGGTTRELLELEAEIRAVVFRRFGVRLEREPILVGP
jgi:UDP-N-acetylmuramate dehydrogenase